MSPSQSVCYLFSTCFSHHREIAIRETVLMDVVLRRSALLNRENGKQSLMYVSSRLNRPQQKP